MKCAPLLALILSGCASPDEASKPQVGTALDVAGCHNVYRLSEKLISGSEPHGEEGLQALAKLGVKAIISVDGGKPDAAAAKKYGMRYVHLPIGYDGVPRDRALEIARAVRDLEGPIYMHCHHGKHRGPAAAAIALAAAEGWPNEKAVAAMKMCGTSLKYEGLYEDVKHFRASSEDLDRVDGTFPEVAKLPGFQAAMALLSRTWEHLEEVREARWKRPPDHPDIDPPHEALQLLEFFKELERTEEVKAREEDFRGWMGDSVAAAARLEDSIRRQDHPGAEEAFRFLKNSCTSCHSAYRNKKR
ncbi:MAG: cytochrome c [Planctomycetes bacterium]|nr:cytochrome c [Planctomycetota bacterium]